MGGFEKVALKKAADYAALEFRKTICAPEGGTAAKLTGCSDDQPVQTTLLSGCRMQPSSPRLRLFGA